MSDPIQRQQEFTEQVSLLRQSISQVIVGQHTLIDHVLVCLLCGGHALLEGVPGLGKTKLVKTLAEASGLDFSRVQFTPDLMPADIIGTTIIHHDERGQNAFDFRPGPIFAQILLADEINRATPKTQSALLEAMQEGTVTVADTSHRLPSPYFVLATQNPLEMEGTYPLPEAQLDRFMFKVHVPFPSHEELGHIFDRTTGVENTQPKKVLNEEHIISLQRFTREIVVAPHIREYMIRLLESTHPERSQEVQSIKRFVRFGASPRGGQACLLAAKAFAALDGRLHVSVNDIQAAYKPAFRHRVILNFEGTAENVAVDALLDEILKHVAPTD